MAAKTPPQPPAGLQDAGQALWSAVTSDYQLEEHELALLNQAARTVDLIDDLQARWSADGLMSESSQGSRVHPAVVEVRAQRLALARLLSALKIPTGELP